VLEAAAVAWLLLPVVAFVALEASAAVVAFARPPVGISAEQPPVAAASKLLVVSTAPVVSTVAAALTALPVAVLVVLEVIAAKDEHDD